MSPRFPQLFLGLLALAVALTISGLAGASALRDFRRDDEVAVTGSARRPIRSDFIVWRASITTQQPTPAAAYQDLRRHTDRVRSFLAEQGLPDSLVSFRSVETFPISEMREDGRGETGRVLGYRLTQWIEVRSTDVDGVTGIAQRADDLISEGIPLMSPPPEYLFTRLADLRTEMLAEATRDARARAQVIAESAGGRIGAVRNARMGVFQITPRHSTEVSDYGINDTSSLDKDITAVVRITFAVD